MRTLIGAAAALLIAAGAAQARANTASPDPRQPSKFPMPATGWVDPFIGTGADGHTFPGAVVPFGMVQLSPDTYIGDFRQRAASYTHAAGYRYEDSSIQGFSHTHFSGAGHSDLGDVSLMPISGDVKLDPGEAGKPGSGYRSTFSHKNETASPGYYAVKLDSYDITAELTATARVGVHRYRFPTGKPAHVLLDLRHVIYDYPGKVLWSQLRIRNDDTITGMRETRGWAPGRKLYFAIRFSQPIAGHALYDREPAEAPYHGFAGPGTSARDIPFIQGRGLVGVFDFADLKGPLVAKVALSPSSEAAAIANMDAEVKGFDFDAVRAQVQAGWETQLDRVRVSAPEPMKKTLYTALYHSLMAPSVASDVDGTYRGPDNELHQAKDFGFVSSFSLWDTYRAEQPLMTLIQPYSTSATIMRSLQASQLESPYHLLPVWQFAGLETWCMIGYHAVPELADAIMKDIPGFDKEAAFGQMVVTSEYGPYGHLQAYLTKGYVPVDLDGEAVSKTLEYAFDDWSIAQAARKLGKETFAREYDKRAQYWRNVFNPATGFVQPKLANGQWAPGFDPAKAGEGSGFTEGNAWQYSQYEPQDIGGLIKLMGGDQALVKKLDLTFDQKVDPKAYAHVEDMAGLIGQYVHGNEPSHHMAYLYAYAGAPWRTQARLKQIVDSQYRPAPDGLVGNDDLGQMSAWMIFTALGFYPVAPGSNEYVIGRPFVEKAEIALPNGKTFTVVTDGLSDARPYVGKVTLNGKPLDKVVLTHAQILAGGELRFTMQPKPSTTWGTGVAARPYSMTPYR